VVKKLAIVGVRKWGGGTPPKGKALRLYGNHFPGGARLAGRNGASKTCVLNLTTWIFHKAGGAGNHNTGEATQLMPGIMTASGWGNQARQKGRLQPSLELR